MRTAEVLGGDHYGDDDLAPKAFVTIILFDRNFNFLSAGWDQITTDGEQVSGTVKEPPHDELFQEVTVQEPGYAYIFISNEHPYYVDVYFDDVTVTQTTSPIVSSSEYYPFGLTFNFFQKENSLDQKYLYNKKELQDELAVNTYDFGFRQYDPAIARWNVVDQLSEKRYWMNPYNYVQNNPVNRFDPSGLTDYTLDKNTGNVRKVADTKDETDRIVKTRKDGSVKRKGEGFLGRLVRESKRGEAKTAVGGIEKGILKDGANFKTKHITIAVGGEGQPTLGGVRDFALKLSNYVGKEVGGQYLSNKGSTSTDYVAFGPYVSNDAQHERSGLILDPSLLGKVNITTDWHTHLSKFGDGDRLVPSGLSLPGGDVEYKRKQIQSNPSLRFIIITNPSAIDQRATEIEY